MQFKNVINELGTVAAKSMQQKINFAFLWLAGIAQSCTYNCYFPYLFFLLLLACFFGRSFIYHSFYAVSCSQRAAIFFFLSLSLSLFAKAFYMFSNFTKLYRCCCCCRSLALFTLKPKETTGLKWQRAVRHRNEKKAKKLKKKLDFSAAFAMQFRVAHRATLLPCSGILYPLHPPTLALQSYSRTAPWRRVMRAAKSY